MREGKKEQVGTRMPLAVRDGFKVRLSQDPNAQVFLSNQRLASIVGLKIAAKKLVRGCEKFVPALVLSLALPGSCLARFAYFFADLCML